MVDHHAGREEVVKALKAELVGPDPRGEPLDTSGPVVFDSAKDSYGPWVELQTGEEILQGDLPTVRYGIGVLYPRYFPPQEEPEPADLPGGGDETDPDDGAAISESAAGEAGRKEGAVARAASGDGAADDAYELAGANDYRPSSMALSFLLDSETAEQLKVVFTGARYQQLEVQVGGKPRRPFWLRRPVEATWDLDPSRFPNDRTDRQDKEVRLGEAGEPEQVIKFFARTRPKAPGQFLVTLGVTNNSSVENADARALFQVGLHIDTGGDRGVLPYPDSGRRARDSEEESLDLLYRHHRTYAVGHGCAVDWSDTEQDSSVGRLRTNSLPEYEAHSITPDIKDAEGNEITVGMVPLAGLVEDDDGTASLERLVTAYEEWINRQRVEADTLSSSHRDTALRHLDLCVEMSTRMRAGLQRLASDTTVKRAFQLANKAILEQQIRQGNPLRKPEWDKGGKRFKFPIPATNYDPLRPPPSRGFWRPFQIAFILATLCSAVDPEDPDREVVDLLFFPTGGGKTEAYLGLTAFTLYHRRLLDPDDKGTHVLMRYTLRLLTAQQFQRAASLICAMELERQQSPEELGGEQFRIGIWVGSATTPNTCKQAVVALNELKRNASEAVNKFVVIRCPWCNAQIGPVKTPRGSGAPTFVGYKHTADTVKIHCSDNECAFFVSGLPVNVIDEEIYERPPAMLIATVDKFARLAWIHTPRSLFGFGPDGTRTSPPPGLIIQDELHLISGPLGSMVGLYEVLIEDLCSDGSKPKIVSSTATIRRFEEQVRGLFARDGAAIFPPHGIEAEESFFATVARDENGKPRPGRRHVGVFGPGHGSLQTTQVRTFAALLQAAKDLGEDGESDPWWTLMAFFNSLRELGGALSLLQRDVPNRRQVLRQRMGREWAEMRKLRDTLELTGRLNSEEVQRAVESLSVSQGGSERPVDVCLASNIIEVGVDIARLSLLVIVGQPKTTGQYIQVSGRIGRLWEERPGLVVTLYGATKPRDRSHFEKFRSYHERLHAQVEPTSVTPFSPPALERAAHALLIAHARQTLDTASASAPFPYPDAAIRKASELLTHRVAVVDPGEAQHLVATLQRRVQEWTAWQPSYWERPPSGDDYLMRDYGGYVEPWNRNKTWPVPNSLRNVDAECRAVITALYAVQAGQTAASGAPDGSGDQDA